MEINTIIKKLESNRYDVRILEAKGRTTVLAVKWSKVEDDYPKLRSFSPKFLTFINGSEIEVCYNFPNANDTIKFSSISDWISWGLENYPPD